MVEQKTIDYVKNAVSKGFSSEQIKELLKKYKYSTRDIDEALWIVSRDMAAKEDNAQEAKAVKAAAKKAEAKKPKQKQGTGQKPKQKSKKQPDKKTMSLGSFESEPEVPKPEINISDMPDMPGHIKPKDTLPIPEIESDVNEKIQQKFSPEKEKKHILWVLFEIIFGILLFAAVGVLMYLFMWPALLKVI